LFVDQLKKAFGFGPQVTAEEEIQQFINGLRSMSNEDIGIILAVATVVRVNLEDQNHLPMGIYSNCELPPPQVLTNKMVDMAKVARHFDRLGQTTDAVATVAVLNTLRCLNAGELRPLGRGIWTELVRGIPDVEKALLEGEQNKGEPFPKRVWSEYTMIPAGLEPCGMAQKPIQGAAQGVVQNTVQDPAEKPTQKTPRKSNSKIPSSGRVRKKSIWSKTPKNPPNA